MDSKTIMLLAEGLRETVYMTLVSTFLGYLIGLPVGILLTVTDKDGIRPNAFIYRIMDVIINIMRSIPFLILLSGFFYGFFSIQMFAVLAWVPIFLYSGERGRGGKGLQYGSYVFYPLHMLILGLFR